MSGLLKRLLQSGAAYQAASVISAALGALMLPIYTRALTPEDYGVAETLLTFLILASIPLRLGLGEAFVRFWFDDEDPERRRRVARTTTGTVLVLTTVAALAGLAVAGPLSDLLLDERDVVLMGFGLLGLWAFTNLEVAYALLRVEERRREYFTTSLFNVLVTVVLTFVLVVVFDAGARGYVAGNYVASTLVLFSLWWRLRDRLGFGFGSVGPLLRFGLPTVPADMAVFSLNVIDRAYLLQTQGKAAAGVYAVSVKLATAVIVAVRGFQLAWAPLAYSITDDDEARRFYARVTTYYVLFTGLVVAALTLLGRWVVRLLAAPEFYPAHEALPWVSLGWALYGLFLVLVAMAGRAQVTVRNVPAALCGLAANVVLLLLLVEPLGIAGAGIALCGAYAVMLVAMYALTRSLFRVDFEWRRLVLAVAVLAAITVAAELLAPTEGAGGFALRALALAVLPAALWLAGFFEPGELRAARGVVRRRTVAKV